jgi:toxin-antitoxin system PIN domain toxin
MLCVDINVLVNAYLTHSPTHAPVSAWMREALSGTEVIALPFEVVTGFMRVVTDRRIFQVPATPTAATAFIDDLIAHPRVLIPVDAMQRYSGTRRLIHDLGLAGQDVPDAALAALALDLGASMVTSDRGFRRFPGLAVIDPANFEPSLAR